MDPSKALNIAVGASTLVLTVIVIVKISNKGPLAKMKTAKTMEDFCMGQATKWANEADKWHGIYDQSRAVSL